MRAYRVRQGTERPKARELPLPDKPSIAILPLTNMSGDPAQESFSDGLTEDLITDLSRNPGLFVIARNSTFAYKGRSVDVRKIAADLGVRYLLEGSVRRAEQQVRVTAQLIDAETGAHLWAERFDRGAADLLTLQAEVTGQIARMLNLELMEAESQRATRGRPDTLEAIDYARKAWAELWTKPMTQETNAQALADLEQALALDPTVPEIWTNRAVAYQRAAFLWSPAREESLRLARDAAERAVTLDPRSADAHYVLGLMLRFQGDLDRLREESETVVALNPNHALGVAGLGIYRLLDGRPREALPYFERAFRLSPRDPQRAIWHLWVGLAYVMLGDDRKALEESKRSAAANPQYSPAFALQVSALALLGREAEARAALAVLQQLQPDVTITRNKEDRGYRVANPEFHCLIERYLDGLRKAGLPE